MDFLTPVFAKVFSIFMSLLVLLGIKLPGNRQNVSNDHSKDKTNYTYVYLHGFWGWGEYDEATENLPYWGFFTGDSLKKLEENGFKVVAPSVDPVGSAWDRACEMYAQLTGTRVDYGKAHSEKYAHERYGEDYTGRGLLEKWDSTDKINIVAHSFGGPTSYLFASVMEYGSAEEKEATTDGTLSPFFEGGKGDYIYSITGLAGTYRGTSLVLNSQALEVCANDLNLDVRKLVPSAGEEVLSVSDAVINGLFGLMQKVASGDVAAVDTALYDMHPDNAAKLNLELKPVDGIYYFSVPHCTTEESEDGTHQNPRKDVTDFMYFPTSCVIGRTNDVTPGGIVMDKSWQPNDGMVNTISERAPVGVKVTDISAVPGVELAAKGFQKGIFNVFPTYEGAHMSLMGNPSRPDGKCVLYLADLMYMINAL